MVNMEEESGRKRLLALLETFAVKQGRFPSALKEVDFVRTDNPMQRAPIIYDPSIFIVAQGRKRVYLGDNAYVYDPYNYLVLSVPLPLECETEASPEKPLMGMAIKVDPLVLSELLVQMDDQMPVPGSILGLYSTELTKELTDAAVRLLECLRSPMESRILGKAIVREITFRVLSGDQGGTLRALAARNSHFSQIAKVLNRMHQEYQKNVEIEDLAKEVNMSVSTFHHNFKSVTSTSPLQYLKSIRLHKARLMMAHDGFNASSAAYEVGYLSASQFSREFKRFFGNSPADEAARIRAMTD